jgi:hypothetical protein
VSNWTARIPTAFPATLLAAANQLAAIIDPDTNGGMTFAADMAQGGYVYAQIPYKVDFEPIVRERNPARWQEIAAQYADEKGMARMDPETIETLRQEMLFDEEFVILAL